MRLSGHGTMVMGVIHLVLGSSFVPLKAFNADGQRRWRTSFELSITQRKTTERHQHEFRFENQFSGVIERAELCKSVETSFVLLRGPMTDAGDRLSGSLF